MFYVKPYHQDRRLPKDCINMYTNAKTFHYLVLHLFCKIIESLHPNPPSVCARLPSPLIGFSSPCIIPDRPPALFTIMYVMFLFLVAVLWLLLQMSAPSPPFLLFFVILKPDWAAGGHSHIKITMSHASDLFKCQRSGSPIATNRLTEVETHSARCMQTEYTRVITYRVLTTASLLADLLCKLILSTNVTPVSPGMAC